MSVYGQWLGYLHRQGHPLDTAPTRDGVQGFRTDTAARTTDGTALDYLALLLQAVERLYPETDWLWLDRLIDGERRSRRPRPPRQAQPPTRSTNQCLRLDDWPSTLRQAWLAAQRRAPTRYADNDGVAAHWSPAFRRRIETALGMLLACQRRDGRSSAIDAGLIDVFIADLRSRMLAPWSVHSHVEALRIAAVCVIDPRRDWGWLTGVERRLRVEAMRAPGAKRKAARRVSLQTLAALGYALLNEARSAPHWGPNEAVRFRDGLMILVLTYRALRRANLLALRIGTTLILDARGARVQFAAAAMKGRRSFGVRIDPLRPLIDEYLRDWRPRLGVPSEEPMLWAARRGAPLSASACSTRIGDLIEKRLGVRISPHFFRDRLATTLVEDRPTDGAALGTTMLAHRDGGVTDRHYRAYAESLVAQEAVELVLGGYADDDDLMGALGGTKNQDDAAGVLGLGR
ncbi:tyrosine-type recombinase/integrase [Azospirillum brasilense]|uniref:tyrosine-type recombinase/integrase n=1 Tax=Azospirillum brasilense TaxID=192 RepID=UPI00157B712D|nr:tyrosine-type recombinase/integrase [Azospirillum brasilense]